ncbi:MAG: alpha/beta fold hydrolase [Acidimicrobiia bacterium]
MLLHSLGEDSTTWDRVAEALALRHSVYAFDLRGHGASQHMAQYSLELMRDDVLGALAELDLADTCLVGHSLGGMVAYLAAEQQPTAIGRLVLEEAPPPLPAAPVREVPEKPDTALPFDWDVIPALYAQRNDPDPQWWDSLARISIPTLVIAGGRTSHVDQQQLAEMAERIADSRMVTIEAGHNVHALEPEAFVSAIAAFLNP